MSPRLSLELVSSILSSNQLESICRDAMIASEKRHSKINVHQKAVETSFLPLFDEHLLEYFLFKPTFPPK